MPLLVRWLLSAAALLLISQWISAVSLTNYTAALWAALVIGLLNAFLRPLLILLTLPVTVLTLGLFLFVVNALIFQLAGKILDGFSVAGFWPALGASVLYSLWGLVIDAALERVFPRPKLPPPFGPGEG
jgi:putative membrane protein